MESRSAGTRVTKRLALLGHCILNQNARAPGIAIHRGVVLPLYEMLKAAGYEMLQLPCPETTFNGVSRWWFVYEQYDSVAYRRHCARLARSAAQLAKTFSARGYKIVLVGLGISPSCGVRMKQTSKEWRGRPFDVGDRATVEKGEGVWIEELVKAMGRAGVTFRMLDVPPVVLYPPGRSPEVPEYPSTEAAAWEEMKRFLEA